MASDPTPSAVHSDLITKSEPIFAVKKITNFLEDRKLSVGWRSKFRFHGIDRIPHAALKESVSLCLSKRPLSVGWSNHNSKLIFFPISARFERKRQCTSSASIGPLYFEVLPTARLTVFNLAKMLILAKVQCRAVGHSTDRVKSKNFHIFWSAPLRTTNRVARFPDGEPR